MPSKPHPLELTDPDGHTILADEVIAPDGRPLQSLRADLWGKPTVPRDVRLTTDQALALAQHLMVFAERHGRVPRRFSKKGRKV